jgi:hypothetical protein
MIPHQSFPWHELPSTMLIIFLRIPDDVLASDLKRHLLGSISMANMIGNVDNACATSRLRWMARSAADVRQCTKLGVNDALAC